MNRLLIATLIALPTLAPAQQIRMTNMICFPAGAVAALVANKYGEAPAGIAETTNGGLFLFYLNPENGSFSLSMIPKASDGKEECIVASGAGFNVISPDAIPNL